MTATGSNSILRQVRPVAYLGSTPTIALSDIPYHGHRFVGEYYNPGKDINIPVSFRTGTTPPQ